MKKLLVICLLILAGMIYCSPRLQSQTVVVPVPVKPEVQKEVDEAINQSVKNLMEAMKESGCPKGEIEVFAQVNPFKVFLRGTCTEKEVPSGSNTTRRKI